MTREQQKLFVEELCNNIRDDLLKKIDENEIPDNWDGHELRVFVADRFEESARISVFYKDGKRDGRRKRAAAYRKAVLNMS